jgi:hypothetical protein
MHLLQKRIMYLNSDDALTDSNDTRGDLLIPVPQQLPDPGATDLVFKMYVQDAVIINDNTNINSASKTFTVSARVFIPQLNDSWEVYTKSYDFPTIQFSEIDFVEMWNVVFGNQKILVEGANTTPPMPPGIKAAVKGFDSFQLEWTTEAYENDREETKYGYRPAIEREPADGFPAFMPLGDRLMCILKKVTPNSDQSSLEGKEIAWMANHIQVTVTASNPGGGRILGMDLDPTQSLATRVLVPFWAAQHPSPLAPAGTFVGPGGDAMSFQSPPDNLEKVYNAATNAWEPYPTYEAARAASAMPHDMLMDDLTQLHINTDLPVQNSEVRPKEGLCQSRITALVPVGVPHGSTIYYQDAEGINAAYERNQSTLSRLHIWLTDKYGNPYNPASQWTFSFALEIWQDDFKRMLDVLLASQSLHESTVRLHKLGLVGASFQALEG